MSAHEFENRAMKVVTFRNSIQNPTGHYLENYCRCGYRATGPDTVQIKLKMAEHLSFVASFK